MNLNKAIICIIKLSLLGCGFGTNYNNDIPFYQEIYEDHSNGYTYPDSGFYYQYKFSHYTDKIQNVNKMLHQFLDKGIVVFNAWYREGINGCVLPGGARTKTIYYPIFLIMTKEEYPDLKNRNFYQVFSPGPIGFCRKPVLRYYLVNF